MRNKICKICSKEIMAKRNKFFCSKYCLYKSNSEFMRALTFGKTGEKCHNWKDAKTINSAGYVVITRNKKRIYEHRHIMEKFHKRKLKKNEVVHHINGIRHDNSLDNLVVVTEAWHGRHHHSIYNKWSRKYDFCLHCKTTRRPYRGKGKCDYCYNKEAKNQIRLLSLY